MLPLKLLKKLLYYTPNERETMTKLLFNNVLVTIAVRGTVATIKRYADGILNTEITKTKTEAEALEAKLKTAGYVTE